MLSTAVNSMDIPTILATANRVMFADIPDLVDNSTVDLRTSARDVLSEVASIVEPLLLSTKESFENVSDTHIHQIINTPVILEY